MLFLLAISSLIKNFKAGGEGIIESSLLLPNAEVSAERPGLVIIVIIVVIVIVIILIVIIVVVIIVIIVCFPLSRGCLGQCCMAQERFYFQR